MQFKALDKTFFERPADKVAKDLLGKTLVRVLSDGTMISDVITETEAYLGQEDKACHAYKGITQRTKVMFGPAAVWYIYLIYGMYDMINVVTYKEGEAHAVLIRGTRQFNGPGKLSKAFRVDSSFNGKSVSPDSALFIADSDFKVNEKDVIVTPRIGIDYAEEWKDKPLRFYIEL